MRGRTLVMAAVFGAAALGCTDSLCIPRESSFGFFSLGDCVLTDSGFFQGHEWLTYFGNGDLPAPQRFSKDELHAIAEGNRRVDWPKELLVHMNTSVVHYTQALTEHTDLPENQKLHFLLDDRNDDDGAIADSLAEIRRLSIEAVQSWSNDRLRALTSIGRACHTLQDSFSPAHTVRDRDDGNCIVKVKAYIERASGFDSPDIEFHGGTDEDTIGHTTTEDSIYRAGRACHSPNGAAEVEACLSDAANDGRDATRDYLGAMRWALASYAISDEPDAAFVVDSELEPYFEAYFRRCE